MKFGFSDLWVTSCSYSGSVSLSSLGNDSFARPLVVSSGLATGETDLKRVIASQKIPEQYILGIIIKRHENERKLFVKLPNFLKHTNKKGFFH